MDEELQPMTIGELADVLDDIGALLHQPIRVRYDAGCAEGLVVAAQVCEDGSIELVLDS